MHICDKKVTITDNHYDLRKSVILQCGDLTGYNNNEYYSIRVLDENNQKITGKTVIVTINNVNYNVKTDNEGVARLKLETLPLKTYDIKIIVNDDDNYKSASKNAKLTVKTQKTTMKVKAGKKTVKITLKNQFKKELSKVNC